jgi:hypothetical protein
MDPIIPNFESNLFAEEKAGQNFLSGDISAGQPRAGDGGTQAEIGQVLSGFAADQRNEFGSGDPAGFGGGSSLKSQRLSAAASSACFWTERAFAYSVL